MDIVAIIGAVSGLISLLMLGYTLGVWKGAINTKVELLWKISVEDELVRQRHNDLVGSSSDWQIKEKGEALLPEDLKHDIEGLLKKRKLNPDGSIADIVKHIGLSRLSRIAQEKGATIQIVVALMYAYGKTLLRKQT